MGRIACTSSSHLNGVMAIPMGCLRVTWSRASKLPGIPMVIPMATPMAISMGKECQRWPSHYHGMPRTSSKLPPLKYSSTGSSHGRGTLRTPTGLEAGPSQYRGNLSKQTKFQPDCVVTTARYWSQFPDKFCNPDSAHCCTQAWAHLQHGFFIYKS